mgnify:CR=1 FL=1
MPLIQSNTPCKIYVGVSSISLIVFQFLLFFTLLTPVYAAGNSQDYSDQFVCSWFDLKDPPIKFINEANNRNIDCKRIFSSSSKKVQYYCKYGYKRVGTSCVKKTALIIPANAYKSGNTWYCKSGYKKTGNSCTKIVLKTINIPANAYKSGNTWYCKSGYKKTGNSCTKIVLKTINIPANAYKSGNSWKCFSSHYKNNNSCIKLPSNASAFSSGDGFYCKTDYKKSGARCIKSSSSNNKIPANAYKSGNTWYCKSGYKKTGNSCTKSVSNKNIPNQNYDGEKIVSNIEYEAANTNKSVNTTSDNKAALFFLLLLVIGLLIPNSRGRIKKCAWCRSKKIKFISGTKGPWEWKYSNKDGSRDKRRKDNVELASYISEFNCKKCNATTDFFHKPSNSPSKRKKIIKRQLVDSGSGKRKGSDYGV